MPGTVSIRLLQTLLGSAYAFLALVAVIKSPGFVTLLAAVAVMLASYLTARTISETLVTPDVAWRASAIGVAIIGIGTVADAVGRPHTLEWPAIVMAYGAGNRFRAAGIGPAR